MFKAKSWTQTLVKFVKNIKCVAFFNENIGYGIPQTCFIFFVSRRQYHRVMLRIITLLDYFNQGEAPIRMWEGKVILI